MRRALYRMSLDTLARILQSGVMLHCIDGLPPASILVGSCIQKGFIILEFEHPWFDEIPESSTPPMRHLTLDITQSPLRILT